MRRLFGRERMVQQVQRRRLGTGFPALHLVQRHDQCGCLPHLLAQTLRRHPLRQRHPRRYREVQHPGFRSTPRHALAAYRRGALHPRLPALLRAEKLRRMSLRRLYGKPQRTAAVRTREHPYDRREDLSRLRRGLCPRPGAEPDGSVRPRGERRLPGAEGHGALDRSHAALQRVDAQGRHPQLCVGLPVVRPRALGRRSRSRQGRDGFRGRGTETLLALPGFAQKPDDRLGRHGSEQRRGLQPPVGAVPPHDERRQESRMDLLPPPLQDRGLPQRHVPAFGAGTGTRGSRTGSGGRIRGDRPRRLRLSDLCAQAEPQGALRQPDLRGGHGQGL